MEDKKNRDLKDRLRECAPDGRISCKEAWSLAEETGATKKEVGRAADELKIKVHTCQLGCF